MNACRTLTDACRTAPVALTAAVGGHVHETRGWVGAAGTEQSGVEEQGRHLVGVQRREPEAGVQ